MELTGLKYQVPVSRCIAEGPLYAPRICNQGQGIEEAKDCADYHEVVSISIGDIRSL